MPSSHRILRSHRTVRYRAWLVLCVIAAVLVPAATAHAAPTLSAPAAGASTNEGKSVTYTWTGDLMGADAAKSQAYFRVEVIAAANAPSDPQAAWPNADNTKNTDPGDTATSIVMGAPPAGSWKWRVCAWGVVDPTVSPTVEQIPNGCSAARTLTSSAAVPAGDTGTVKEVVEQQRETVRSAPTIIEKVRPAAATPAPAPAPKHVAPVTTDDVASAPAPIRVEPRASEAMTSGGAHKSSLALSSDSGIGDATDAQDTAARAQGGGKLTGALAGGLGATLPGVPIPFWVLLFIIACIPIAIIWRRSVMAMFEWSDGSIDGFGTPDARTVPVLSSVQDDRGTHRFGGAADDAATEPLRHSHDAA